MDDTLCIPTIFISYTGEALDYKAPLLRSLHAVNVAGTEVCHYFNEDVKKVSANLGWEQEYFLVDENLYSARQTLCLQDARLWDIRLQKTNSWKTTISVLSPHA
jgi:glutamine synthetase